MFMAVFVACIPLSLVWGWFAYLDCLKQPPPRLRFSLFGLVCATVSLVSAISLLGLFVLMRWDTSGNRILELVVFIGALLAVAGAFVALFGRLRLLAPILLASVGAVLLWFCFTLT